MKKNSPEHLKSEGKRGGKRQLLGWRLTRVLLEYQLLYHLQPHCLPQTVLHPLHPPILLNRLLVRLLLLPPKPRKKRLDLLRLLYQMHHPLQQPRQPLYHSSLRETRTLALLLCLLPRLLRVHPSRRQQVPVIVEMPLWPMPRWRDEARKRTTLSPRMDECDVFEEQLKGLRRRIIVRDERRRS